MIQLRASADRGVTRLNWLFSRHSFSFGNYYDPRHMGISVLRVINDDRVQPSAGFAPHSHRDMEILSYVKRGAIEHRDSVGTRHVLPAGQFQLMSAGTGITHSEYNPSAHELLEFLQIWIIPHSHGVQPAYQQKRFDCDAGLCLIASPDGRDDSLLLNQDARVFHLRRSPRAQTLNYHLTSERVGYLHMIAGSVAVGDQVLNAGDGAHITEVDVIDLSAEVGAELLLFDLPEQTPPVR